MSSDGIERYAGFVSAYSFPIDANEEYPPITVSRSGYAGEDTWAIRHTGFRLGRDERFDHEPQNSSRTDEFITGHTFTLAEALPIATRIAALGRDGIARLK